MCTYTARFLLVVPCRPFRMRLSSPPRSPPNQLRVNPRLRVIAFRVQGQPLKVPCSYYLTAIGKLALLQVPKQVSTMSFVVLMIGNSRSNHLGAQGTFNPNP